MSKLDDLLGKKKEIVPVLDLSKTICNSKEDYKRLSEKVPDYKMRPIKVRSDEIKIKDQESGLFKMPKKEYRTLIRNNGERERPYIYLDPIPAEMRSLVIMELCTVPIDWKMLTTLRPKTKLEEDYYSKLIELGKLQIKTEHRDKREYIQNPAIRKVKNKSGIIETRVQTCAECSEEYCNGRTCQDFNYDLYSRIQPKSTQLNKGITAAASGNAPDTANDKKSGEKKKNRSHRFKSKKQRQRSKSPVKRSKSTSKK